MRLALVLAPLAEQPLRAAVTVLAIALGVALASAVWLVNAGALEEFGLAARKLVGDADLVVRGPRAGFAEVLYGELARLPGIDVADPMLELDAALPDALPTATGSRPRPALHVIGLDPFRAASIQPALLGELGADLPALLEPDGIFLSASAARELGQRTGGHLEVLVGTQNRRLRVLGILSEESYPGRLGLMDIAAAQATFARLGELNRIDLRLAPGASLRAVRAELARVLPAGVHAVAPEVERDRAVNVTRAYRVNLNMLALVSLLTGAFLVFSTQSLAVLRRRTSLALLRALGMTRGELERMLLGEALLLGFGGAVLGVALGQLIARVILALLAGDLGNGQLAVSGVRLPAEPLAWLAFVAIGTGVACLGAWVPAREAARRPPARALKAGDAQSALEHVRSMPAGFALLGLGIALALLPAVGGLPLFGYLAIAALLFGAVLLVPAVAAALLARAPRTGRVPLDAAIAQLQGSVGQSTISLAAIIVSFSLMIAMAVMVNSFRVSFVHWLDHILPADLELRTAPGSDTVYLDPAAQARLRATPGVARIAFRRTQPLALAGDRPPVALVTREIASPQAPDTLTLVASLAAGAADPARPPAWVSEAMVDLYGARLGAPLVLPLAGRRVEFQVAGIFRDYGRSTGTVVIAADRYLALTHDATATEASFWLVPGADGSAVLRAIRARLPGGDAIDVRSTGEVRAISLRIFDRAFAVTYALEAIAVLIGLVGVSFASSSTTLARRGEFGMLRHLGMLRGQVLRMLAAEGCVMSLVGVLYGLVLGVGLSLVLVYVINRQSFSWSVDLTIPWLQVGGFSLVLVAAAAVTATLSGRAAMSVDAVRAVREDW